MCRSAKDGKMRRCPSHTEPEAVEAYQERRRELYAAGKQREQLRGFLDAQNVRYQSGADMPVEYYVSQTGFCAKLVKPIKDEPSVSLMSSSKPLGGIWTSPARKNEDGTVSSEWSDWIERENGASAANGKDASHVKALKQSVIMVIDNEEDAEKLFKTFPREDNGGFSYEKMADAGVDGLHLTQNAINASRSMRGEGYLTNFYSWDLVSTCWLHPVHLTPGKKVKTGGYEDDGRFDAGEDDYEIDFSSESFSQYSEDEVEALRKLLTG